MAAYGSTVRTAQAPSPPLYPRATWSPVREEGESVLGLALAMFIALFGFGHELVGWSDPGGEVQLGLFMSFLFGIVCGYRTRG
jgi:hypothetical protein